MDGYINLPYDYRNAEPAEMVNLPFTFPMQATPITRLDGVELNPSTMQPLGPNDTLPPVTYDDIARGFGVDTMPPASPYIPPYEQPVAPQQQQTNEGLMSVLRMLGLIPGYGYLRGY